MNMQFLKEWINIELASTFVIIFVVSLFYRHLWHHLHTKSKKTGSLLDTSFLDALHTPFYLLLILFAFNASIPFIPDSVYKALSRKPEHFEVVLQVGFSLFILIVFNKFLSNIQKTIIHIEKNTAVPNSHAWISACKLGRLISFLVFILVILSMLNIPMGQILAPTAVGALALSFASKDILSNVFGGVMVMCDRPFAVGDYVKIANNEEGTVRYIGWRVTEVQLRTGRILHVPNGLIATATVTNYTEKTHWYIQKEIGIRYQDLDVAAKIAEQIEQWVTTHSHTNQRRVSFAKLFELSDSSVIIRVRVYLKSSINTKQWYQFTEEMLLKIHEIIKDNRADFAFPTRTVLMEKPEDS